MTVGFNAGDTGCARGCARELCLEWNTTSLRGPKPRRSAFRSEARDINYDASRPVSVSFALNVGSVTETVTVTASNSLDKESRRIEAEAKKRAEQQQTAASANVTNFQRKVAGVLPIRVEVPRTGNSYRFVRPLVLDEETKVTFAYKTK
jgi:hypothetical protein